MPIVYAQGAIGTATTPKSNMNESWCDSLLEASCVSDDQDQNGGHGDGTGRRTTKHTKMEQ